MSKGLIESKIKQILKRQSEFALKLRDIQGVLLEEILTIYPYIVNSNDVYETMFIQFNNTYHLEVIQQLLNDVIWILDENESYFLSEAPETSKAVISDVKRELYKAFGITDALEMGNGYFRDVWQNTTVKTTVRDFIFKEQRNLTMTEAREALRKFVKGDGTEFGIYERFYNKSDDYNPTTIFDLYQKSDRVAQNVYAEQFKMQAAIYIGGLVDATRTFCKDRNGKVFIRSEVESWENLTFAGKPKVGYNPFEDLGGYRCRHHLGWISNNTALRLDKTLKQDANGVLYRS